MVINVCSTWQSESNIYVSMNFDNFPYTLFKPESIKFMFPFLVSNFQINITLTIISDLVISFP